MLSFKLISSLKCYNWNKLGAIILILEMKTLRCKEAERLAKEESGVLSNTQKSPPLGPSVEKPLAESVQKPHFQGHAKLSPSFVCTLGHRTVGKVRMGSPWPTVPSLCDISNSLSDD